MLEEEEKEEQEKKVEEKEKRGEKGHRLGSPVPARGRKRRRETGKKWMWT